MFSASVEVSNSSILLVVSPFMIEYIINIYGFFSAPMSDLIIALASLLLNTCKKWFDMSMIVIVTCPTNRVHVQHHNICILQRDHCQGGPICNKHTTCEFLRHIWWSVALLDIYYLLTKCLCNESIMLHIYASRIHGCICQKVSI